MSLKYTMEAIELLDDPGVCGESVREAVIEAGVVPENVETKCVESLRGKTDFIRVWIPGSNGKRNGGSAPTLGILGRLGGIGARPGRIGLVSDGDGAVAAVAAAMKLGHMARLGDQLKGDVFLSTHICPNAAILPHEPVPFMGSPISPADANTVEISDELDAVLSVDTTRGNRIINERGLALTPTVRQGWILRVSEDLLTILSFVTGRLPRVLPITMQDITPYGNELYHLNSIMQPCAATKAPVVGVAVTSESIVPGCATGCCQALDIDEAVRFVIETAKAFGEEKVSFYNADEFDMLVRLYGTMTRLQTRGRPS